MASNITAKDKVRDLCEGAYCQRGQQSELHNFFVYQRNGLCIAGGPTARKAWENSLRVLQN